MMKSVVALSAGFIAGANAFWRMECPGRVGVARMDPIVNPGELANHVHSISGSSGETLASGPVPSADRPRIPWKCYLP